MKHRRMDILTNVACPPSKNIIHAANVARHARRPPSTAFARDGFTVSMPAVRDRKGRMVFSLNEMISFFPSSVLCGSS
jgi:pyruvate/2-oxoglutarate dehydrogenase complex dihydrolipoamide dehydrogenase (E3) component